MSGESRKHEKGYETLDAQAGATYRAGAYILGAMFGVAALLVPMYWFLARAETRSQTRAASVIPLDPAAAPSTFPRLVTAEPKLLAQFRATEDEILGGWGWVEKDRDIARMPVAEAIRIVGARGALPAFPVPVPSPSPGQPSATPPAAGAGR